MKFHDKNKEINLFRFIERVRDEADNCIIRWLSAADYQEIIKNMCIKCFRSAEDFEDCSECYTNESTGAKQLYLNFEELKE
jgi:hypothetical protein